MNETVQGRLARFGARLRETRLAEGLTQDEFARRGGVSKNSQLQYESGKTAPGVDYLYRLGEHNVDIGYLLTGRASEDDVGMSEALLLDMYRNMSARERDAVTSMMTILTQGTAGAQDLTRATVHSRRQDYRPKDAE